MTYLTKTNKEVKANFMTHKERYIGAYLDGYFSDKNLDYGMKYISLLEQATIEAEKRFKEYKEYEKNSKYIKSLRYE